MVVASTAISQLTIGSPTPRPQRTIGFNCSGVKGPAGNRCYIVHNLYGNSLNWIRRIPISIVVVSGAPVTELVVVVGPPHP